MQPGTDILKLLLFPGLLFMAACGFLLLFMEGWLHAAFYGGPVPRMRPSTASGRGEACSGGEAAAASLSLAAMGVAGVLLVGVRGDLFVLMLLLPAVEVLPLFMPAARGGTGALYVPLYFRRAASRITVVTFVILSVSLRSPGEFSTGLQALRGEGVFGAIESWSGAGFGLMLASLICSAVAFAVFLLGRPSCGGSPVVPGRGGTQGLYIVAAEGSRRAVSLLLFVVLFLGYPWQGASGILLWSAAALGTAAGVTLLRAWSEGLGPVFDRRLQAAAALFALLSFALALSASA